MRQVLCPVLVGRTDELRALLEALDGAAAGRRATVVVVGEAGAGKSRLVREVSGAARGRGLPVLTGRAAGGAVPVPFRPLAEAVLGELRRSSLPDLPELRPFRPALGRLVPEWRPREQLDGAESLVVLGEGVLRLLRALAGDAGCLLVLEDLHWADPETLAVLEYLAGERVLCLATLRPEEGAAGRELAARRAAAVVPLGRLEEAAVVDMARACLGAAALPAAIERWLGTAADGLPFLVEELLAGPVGAALLVEEDGRWSTTGHGRGRRSSACGCCGWPWRATPTPPRPRPRGSAARARPATGSLAASSATPGRSWPAGRAGPARPPTGSPPPTPRWAPWSPGTASSPAARPPRRPWPAAGATRSPGCGGGRVLRRPWRRADRRRLPGPAAPGRGPGPPGGRGDSVAPPGLRAMGVTSREADMLSLVAEGLTNAEIGGRLHLSPRTVEKHVASLLAKTGGQRRAQLAKYAAALSR